LRDGFLAARLRLYVAAFSTDAAAYSFFVLLAVHAQHGLGAGPAALGWLGTITTAVYAALCFFTGGLSDRIGSRPLYLGGAMLLAAVALPAAFFSRSLPHLYIAGALFGVGLGFFWPPLQRQLFIFSPRGALWRTAGTFNVAWAAGICLGSLGGASFYERLGFREGLALCLGLILLTLVCAVWPVPAAAGGEGSRRPPEAPGVRMDARRAAAFLRLAWLANFAAYFAFNGITYLLPHISDRLGFSVLQLGLFLFTANFARFTAFLLLRRFAGWQYSLGWLAVFQLLGGGALAALAFSREAALFYPLFALFGAFAGISYYSSFFYGLNLGARQGRNSGLHEGILSLGMTFGPLLSGLAAKSAPAWPGAVFGFTGLVVLAALVLEWRLARSRA
jgi:MFS family permease